MTRLMLLAAASALIFAAPAYAAGHGAHKSRHAHARPHVHYAHKPAHHRRAYAQNRRYGSRLYDERYEERGQYVEWPPRHRPDPGADDEPWGPKYQDQEQVLQSRYDFSAGRRANIKEYWHHR